MSNPHSVDFATTVDPATWAGLKMLAAKTTIGGHINEVLARLVGAEVERVAPGMTNKLKKERLRIKDKPAKEQAEALRKLAMGER